MVTIPIGSLTKGTALITVSTARPRRVLVAVAAAVALMPAAPAIAQTTALPLPTDPYHESIPQALDPVIDVDKSVIDYGNTHLLSVSGTMGADVQLFGNGVLIRRTTLGNMGDYSGYFVWELQPRDTTQFHAVVNGVKTETVTVRVRRTVTIGVSQAAGVYTFSGQIQRAEAGVQVTIARLDSKTKRVTGVASTTTTVGGHYVIHTNLPTGFAGYYAMTGVNRSALEPGRSRLYGLIVKAQPIAPPVQQQSISLGVRKVGASYVFSGAVTNGGNVPITLARVVNGGLVGVVGGRTTASGSYSLSVPLGSGSYVFQTLTATAKSRLYGLNVPRPVVAPVVVKRTPVEPVGESFEYANCTVVREAGAAPIRRGEPGFGRHLDRDNDGVGCE